MKAKLSGTLFLGFCLSTTISHFTAFAEQPIMGMVPRWDNGYGVQALWFYRDSDTLLRGSNEISNPDGLSERVSKTSIEGVYTWDRSIRATFKMPYLEKTRSAMIDGSLVRKTASGWGDLKLALPLKQYFNKENYSGNWSLTPQIKLPTGDDSGRIPLGDGEVDYAIGASYEKENPYLLYNFGLTFWKTGSSSQRDRWEFESLLAWNFAVDKFVGIDLDAEWENGSSARRIEAGPSFFWWIKKTALLKVGYKHVLDEAVHGTRLSRGDEFRIGLGFVR